MSLVLTACLIRLYKCEHCTLTYSNKITIVWFLHFFFYLGGRWFSKILRNIWGWYVKILTIPYRGGGVVWKRPKTPLRNIKMAPYQGRWNELLPGKTKLIGSWNFFIWHVHHPNMTRWNIQNITVYPAIFGWSEMFNWKKLKIIHTKRTF